jgi:hypothetical protein
MFYKNAVTKVEIEILTAILQIVAHCRDEQKAVRIDFRRFAESEGAVSLKGNQIDTEKDYYAFTEVELTRAMTGKAIPRNPQFIALLMDYFIDEFPKRIGSLSFDAKDMHNIQKELDHLNSQVSLARDRFGGSLMAITGDLNPSDIEQNVPEEFYGEFIGYRRSAQNADVLRFFYEIRRPKVGRHGMVTFENQYRRGDNKWKVTGNGIFSADETLYLFGHARDSDQKDSRGFRAQALRKLKRRHSEHSHQMLCGPVISKAGGEPIAARVLLIPFKRHKWTPHQKTLSKSQLINELISIPSQKNREAHISEIDQNIAHMFTKDNGKPDDEGLYAYISNITPTVIQCYPPDPTHNSGKILQYELELRKLAYEDSLQEKPSYPYEMRLLHALQNQTAQNSH